MERVITEGSRQGWKVKPGQSVEVNVPCTVTVRAVDGHVVSLWLEPVTPHYEFHKVLPNETPPG